MAHPAAIRSHNAVSKRSSSPASHANARLRATPRIDARGLERRRVYLGEGLTISLAGDRATVQGELVDLTPTGIGVAVVEGQPALMPGDLVTIEHTGRGLAGVRQTGLVRHVGEGTFAGRRLPRIGLSLVPAHTPASGVERRGAARYACAETLPVTAAAMSPLFFCDWLYFAVREVAAGGATLTTSIRNKGLLPGLGLDFEVSLAIAGQHRVRGRITSIRREETDREFTISVAWSEPSRDFLAAVAEYLLLGDKSVTPAKLRRDGLHVHSVQRAMTYDYATRDDHEEILALRLRAHQHEGRLHGKTPADIASSFDTHARHVTCRFGGRIVGYVRIIFVDGDASRSQYVSCGHVVPQWLWDAGFVEAGAGVTDPDFQRAGLFLPLMQHIVRIASQSGHRYVLGACEYDLLERYQAMGFELLETREVEPGPGWRFVSRLICLDIDRLVRERPEGKWVGAMAAAAAFVIAPVSA